MHSQEIEQGGVEMSYFPQNRRMDPECFTSHKTGWWIKNALLLAYFEPFIIFYRFKMLLFLVEFYCHQL